MSYLGIFRLEFSNTIVIFELSTLGFVELQSLGRKQKCPNLVPEMVCFGVFGLEFGNNIVRREISTVEFVSLQNLMTK